MTTQATSTERAAWPLLWFDGNHWFVLWDGNLDGARSWFPDEATARRCAASEELEAACELAHSKLRVGIVGPETWVAVQEILRFALARAKPQP